MIIALKTFENTNLSIGMESQLVTGQRGGVLGGKEPEGGITKGQEKILGAAGYVHYIDCGDVSVSVYIC